MFPWSEDNASLRPATRQRQMERPQPVSPGTSILDPPGEAISSPRNMRRPSFRVPVQLSRVGSRGNDSSPPQARRPAESGSSQPVSSPSIAPTYRSEDTQATSVGLAPLQTKGPAEEMHGFEPLEDDDPTSYDLVVPYDPCLDPEAFSLELRSEQMLSRKHLEIIFADPKLLLQFTAYLSTYRPQSISILVYYLDALKALKAIAYSNAIAEALEPLAAHSFTESAPTATGNAVLEEKARLAFDALVRDDLPAYITHLYINTVSATITRRITGTLPPHLREASDGLAEVFCLSDPSRHDNPIMFASEEFHRTTQYGMGYAIGRNCRFLQGPRTNPDSVRRLREAIGRGQEHSEVFLNYRRDGSPFMNLLMIAPLLDSRGTIRYFIGAQVDVSGLVKECTGLESLSRLVMDDRRPEESNGTVEELPKNDEFQALSEMLNMSELETVRRFGGRMHSEQQDEDIEPETGKSVSHRPRLLLKDTSPRLANNERAVRPQRFGNGGLSGVYSHYLLLRPYPSLRILFASPTLRVPGILQSEFVARIGGSARVRDELIAALAEGRGVTAKIRWLTRYDDEGRNRWIHCTPLIGINGQIGVWMIVLVDEGEESSNKRWKQAPAVNQNLSSSPGPLPNYPPSLNERDRLLYTGSFQSNSTNSVNLH